jgi:hypothetical protein
MDDHETLRRLLCDLGQAIRNSVVVSREGLDAERRDGHGLSLVGVVDPEDPNLRGI